jgi:outer membrane protein assembly factor BamB
MSCLAKSNVICFVDYFNSSLMKKMPLAIFTSAWLLASATSSLASDWPNWRGPQHDGQAQGPIRTTWSSDPSPVWQAEVGEGFSGATVVAGKVYTMGLIGKTETLFCLRASDGQLVWKHEWPTKFRAKFYEGGTSATPTVAGSVVYVFGQSGELMALNKDNGKVLWEKNLKDELELSIGTWGFTSAPYVEGDLLILNAGLHGVAVQKTTGNVVWKSEPEAAGYATATPLGKGQIALFGKDHLYALKPASGDIVWKLPWETNYDVNAADPVVRGSRLFVSSGYNRGCALVDFSSGTPQIVWENKELKTQMNPAVLVDGALYGFSGNTTDRAALVCLDWATGETRWRDTSLGFGSVVAVGKNLIILGEKGELAIAPASNSGFAPTARAQILTGKCWTTPTLAHQRLYARNWKGTLLCLDLKP